MCFADSCVRKRTLTPGGRGRGTEEGTLDPSNIKLKLNQFDIKYPHNMLYQKCVFKKTIMCKNE